MENNFPPSNNEQPNVPIMDAPMQQPAAVSQMPEVVQAPVTPTASYSSFQEPETSFKEPIPALNPMTSSEVNPIAVVRVLSSRGVEYVFLTIALVIASISLGALLIALLNGHYDFSVLAYPTAALVVSLPIFALLFLRLKKAENLNPSLAMDPSKRRSTQFMQIYSYIICFLTLIGVVSGIFANMSGSFSGSIVKLILDALVVLVIAGGILFYYWRDEHKTK